MKNTTKQEYYEIIPEKADLESFAYTQSSRMKIYRQISALLDEEKRKIFQIFNFIIAATDRLVDRNKKDPDTFLKFADLTKKVWRGEKLYRIDDYESLAIELISELKKMKEKDFNQVDYIFSDIQEFFYWQFKDSSRRWEILEIDALQRLKLEPNKRTAAIYLRLLFPWLERDDLEEIASKYGLAAKTADDIIDWYDDIQLGFINIPKEDIENLHGVTIKNGCVKYVDKEKLTLDIRYIKREIEKIEILYDEADKLFKTIVSKSTASDLFKDLMNSWLLEAKQGISSCQLH